jgi:hypothetical protein
MVISVSALQQYQCWLWFFHNVISLFLNFVKSATPNQYNRKKDIPGIKNNIKNSNPFGKGNPVI